VPGIPKLQRMIGVPELARTVDRVGEAVVAPMRGVEPADRFFYTLSALADHGIMWHCVAGVRALSGPNGRREAVRLSAGLGIESIVVNGPIKSVFRRTRPVADVARPFRLRTPRTSSFPSGHASAAFFAATLLTEGHREQVPFWFGLAGLVATSRVHVRIHHPSDVVVGAFVGVGLGLLARRLVPLERITATPTE
jgi:undecaprenyl-diphosphatase